MKAGCNAGMDIQDVRRRNLRAFMDRECGGVQAELARRIGLSPSQTADTLSGRKSFGEKVARQIEETAGLRPFALDIDDGGIQFAAMELRAAYVRSRVPVISWVAAGAWDEACDPYAPGAASRWEEIDEHISGKAFALEVRGDSMEKPGGSVSFPDGCLIVVDPTRKPVPGNFVVVRNNDHDEATFKQYVVDSGVRLLKPLNPQYPTLQVKSGTVMVGVVVLKIEKQRF